MSRRRPPGARAIRFLRWGGIAGLLLGGLWWACPVPTAVVERLFSGGLQPFLARLLVPIGDAVPFPAGPAVAGLCLLGALIGLAASWRRGRKRGRAAAWLGWRCLDLGAGLGWIGLVFLLTWGAGYRREPLERLVGIDPARVGPEDLSGLCRHLLSVVREDAPRERNDPPELERALHAVRKSLGRALAQWTRVPPTLPQRVKQTPAGLLLAFGVSGTMAPPFFEPVIDGALTAVSHVAVGAHELAHAAGIAAEGEAEFAGVAAGLAAEDRFARYAAALLSLARCARQLAPQERMEIAAGLPERARADLRAVRETARRHANVTLDHIQTGIYDRYLKAQGVEAGVGDYDRAVRLLAAAWRAGLLTRPR